MPVAWYPRLVHATATERANWELIGSGVDIRWPDLDEDVSVEGLVAGRSSGESQRFLRRWLETRVPRRTAGTQSRLLVLTAAFGWCQPRCRVIACP